MRHELYRLRLKIQTKVETKTKQSRAKGIYFYRAIEKPTKASRIACVCNQMHDVYLESVGAFVASVVIDAARQLNTVLGKMFSISRKRRITRADTNFQAGN